MSTQEPFVIEYTGSKLGFKLKFFKNEDYPTVKREAGPERTTSALPRHGDFLIGVGESGENSTRGWGKEQVSAVLKRAQTSKIAVNLFFRHPLSPAPHMTSRGSGGKEVTSKEMASQEPTILLLR